jgi:TonB family protein
MNYTERNNYIIAVLVSLIIHFCLLTIHLSGMLVPEEPELKTFPVRMVEFSTESKSQQLTVALNVPKKEQPQMEVVEKTTVKKFIDQSAPSEKPEIKSVAPTQPFEDTPLFPEKKETTASDTLVKNPENQRVTGENAEITTGLENSDTGETQSFGTGEAMVKIIGPMPTYPRAALKEGIEGEVTVRILVNADGQLDLPIVIKTSGDVRLDYAATSSIERNWKFTSISKGYYIDLTFSFDLQTKVSVKFIVARTR